MPLTQTAFRFQRAIFNVFQRLVAATDSTGRVWVTWQAFRNNNLEILASVQNGDGFWPETTVSFSPASDWDPAIAASADGQVAISWDTYDKGDYDVYVRRVRFADQIAMDAPIAAAATVNFEARSSLAYDAQNRLWIAYEVAGSRWGKDFGAFDTTGLPLYSSHTVQVVCLVGNDLYVANSDAVLRFPYSTGDTRITVPGVQVVALPAGPTNHHWTKNLIASPDGSTLYVRLWSQIGAAWQYADYSYKTATIH